MNKELARSMLILVNSPHDILLLQQYANYRIDHLRKQLDSLTDSVEIYRVQGQIKELKRLETLRDEVIESAR